MGFNERQLRAFLAVAECGSLGRAARRVHLAQPSLSRLIKAMELRLGHVLFERENRGMMLTAEGELLVPHARHLLHEMQAARDALAEVRGLKRGTVRIGGASSAMRCLIPEALGSLLCESPELQVSIFEGGDDFLVDALRNRAIDLAILTSENNETAIRRIGKCCYADETAVFCRVGHPLPERPDVDALTSAKWIMPPPGTVPRVLFEEKMHSMGIVAPAVTAEATSPDTMLAIAARTDFLCWLPEPIAERHLTHGLIRRLEVPGFTGRREFHLFCREAGVLPAAANRFIAHFPLV